MKKSLLGLVGIGLLVGTPGCHCCRHTAPPCPPPCAQPLPGPPTPLPTVPPSPVPAIPPVSATPSPPPPAFPTVPALPPAGATRNYAPAPVPDARAMPSAPDVRLAPPEPKASSEPPQAQLTPPVNEPAKPPTVKEQPSIEPARGTEEAQPTPALPVGIPQFAYAVEGKVASGLKPALDGLDWLQANGFRTVLHVRAPGEEDAADRRLVEQHGLKFISLEAAPNTITRPTVEAFSRAVSDPAAQPLFVYDRNGAVAGGLWYLHFRTAEQLNNEPARTRAARLGLKPDGDGDQRTMWLAIQKYLSQQP